jgi:hypothetical protein
VVRRIINSDDVLHNGEGRKIIDFFGLSDEEARSIHLAAYQQLLVRVKPIRDQNKRKSIRELWWRFAWERPVIRTAIKGLKRYFVTLSTSKHRFFVVSPPEKLWDGALFAVALEDFFFLGVLSSRVHVVWALSAGGHLGVGNDPTWTNSTCFDPFPFPEGPEDPKARIRELAQALDSHRKKRQLAHPGLTITEIYNVLEKLRVGEALSAKDKVIHEQGLVSVLKQIHDNLDAAVFDAYGWPRDLADEQILEKLVALNAERAEEEKKGVIRWLRPEFQNPAGAKAPAQVTLIESEEEAAAAGSAKKKAAAPWPKRIPEQIAAIRDLLRSETKGLNLAQCAKSFRGTKRAEVEAALESLAALGLAIVVPSVAGGVWKASAGAS